MDKQIMSNVDTGGSSKTNLDVTVELDDYVNDSEELARRTLVGKILTKKILNNGVVRAICSAAWGEASEVKISDMGPNIFLFSFPSEEIVKNIMPKSPWAVMNYILSLQPWNP